MILPGGAVTADLALLELAILIGVSAVVALRSGGCAFLAACCSVPWLDPACCMALARRRVAALVGGVGGDRRHRRRDRLALRQHRSAHALQYLGAAIGSFAVALTVASAFVLLLMALIPVRIADVVVAFSPGAQDTMMVHGAGAAARPDLRRGAPSGALCPGVAVAAAHGALAGRRRAARTAGRRRAAVVATIAD